MARRPFDADMGYVVSSFEMNAHKTRELVPPPERSGLLGLQCQYGNWWPSR